ncbi:MAG: nucleotidyltransferase domain-containing protein [archaeon]
MTKRLVKAVFYVKTLDERRIIEALQKKGHRSFEVYCAEKGGHIPDKGTIVEFMCREDEIESRTEELRQFSDTIIQIGIFMLSTLDDYAYRIQKSIMNHALTPQEISDTMGISMDEVAQILPSDYNKLPYIEPEHDCVYDKYKIADRVMFEISSKNPTRWNIIIDDSYKWRFFTAFSYKKSVVDAKVKKLHMEMEAASRKRHENAKVIVSRMAKKIKDTFGVGNQEIGRTYLFSLFGSTLRGDATKYADLDLLFIWDDTKGFQRVLTEDLLKDGFVPTPEQINELRLKKIVYEEVVRMEREEKLHVSLHSKSTTSLQNEIIMELPLVVHMLDTSEPILGEHLYNSLKEMTRSSKVYKDVKNRTAEARHRMFDSRVNYTDFLYKIKVGEDPAKDLKRFEMVGSQINEDLKMIRKFLRVNKLQPRQ